MELGEQGNVTKAILLSAQHEWRLTPIAGCRPASPITGEGCQVCVEPVDGAIAHEIRIDVSCGSQPGGLDCDAPVPRIAWRLGVDRE